NHTTGQRQGGCSEDSEYHRHRKDDCRLQRQRLSSGSFGCLNRPAVQYIDYADQKQQPVQPVERGGREIPASAPTDDAENGGADHDSDKQDSTNRAQDSGNVLLPSLVSRPLLRDIDVARDVDNFISGDFNRDSRFAFGQAVVLRVFEHEGPIGTRRPLTGFSGDLLYGRCVGSQTNLNRVRSNLARLFLGEAFSRPRFRQVMIDTKHPAAAVDEHLKFFGTLGDITLETGKSHEPVGRSHVGSNESFVCVPSSFLPHESILLTRLSFNPAQRPPGLIELYPAFGESLTGSLLRFIASDLDSRNIGVKR